MIDPVLQVLLADLVLDLVLLSVELLLSLGWVNGANRQVSEPLEFGLVFQPALNPFFIHRPFHVRQFTTLNRAAGATKLRYTLDRGHSEVALAEKYKEKLKAVSSEISKLLNNRGMQLAVCGGKRDSIPPLDPQTGYWVNSAMSNKAPRWIVHLIRGEDAWIAKLPAIDGSERIGAFNTANRPVSCIGVLPLPAVKISEDEYRFVTEWSWLFWVLFAQVLPNGSSAQLMEEYSTEDGTLSYMGEVRPYLDAGLVMLCDPRSQAPGIPDLTYENATLALSRLIQVAPLPRSTEYA